jgi:uncharacterized protein YjdB
MACPFLRRCLFWNFVRNKIYVLKIEMLEPVVMASQQRLWSIYWQEKEFNNEAEIQDNDALELRYWF